MNLSKAIFCKGDWIRQPDAQWLKNFEVCNPGSSYMVRRPMSPEFFEYIDIPACSSGFLIHNS